MWLEATDHQETGNYQKGGKGNAVIKASPLMFPESVSVVTWFQTCLASGMQDKKPL